MAGDQADDGPHGTPTESSWDYAWFWLVAIGIYTVFAAAAGLGYKEARRRILAQLNNRVTSARTTLRNVSQSISSLATNYGRRARTSSGDIEQVGTSQLEQDDELNPELHHAAIRRWQKSSYKAKMKKSAANLEFVAIGLVCYRTVRNFLGAPCVGFQHGVFSWPPPKVEMTEYGFFLLLLWQADRCRRLPRTGLYWGLLFVFNLYIPSSILWPLQWSCRNILESKCQNSDYWYLKEAVHYCDCSLTGVTATLMMMTWILVQPWAMLRREMVYLCWIWLFSVYLLWSVLAKYIVKVSLFTFKDMLGRMILLSCTIVASTIRKWYLEESEKKRFMFDLKQRKASERIFHVFEYMVPEHVVMPMLQGKKIAEPVDQVTIMFVIIAEFDQRASDTKEPMDLLRFLNEVFTEMDKACTENCVSKIETVGEEYVACVGAIPADIEEAKQKGHGHILGKMFRAGEKILRLHWDKDDEEPTHLLHQKWGKVKLKIGLHTGPIVAGVIGKKLPRYRLFGDTINTAARMMQKGQVGTLQFGEPTYRELPSYVEAHFRGDVEMKGKGMVKAYLFDRLKPTGLAEVDAPSRSDSKDRRGRSRMKTLDPWFGKRKSMSHQSAPEDVSAHGDHDHCPPSPSVAESGTLSGKAGPGSSRVRFCSEASDDHAEDARLPLRSASATSSASGQSDGSLAVESRRGRDEMVSRQSDGWEYEHKDAKMFDQVLRTVGDTDSGKWKFFGIGGMLRHLTAEQEEEWSRWAHKNTFTKKFELRVTRQGYFFFFLTLFDFLCAVGAFVFPRSYIQNILWKERLTRLAIFLGCRLACLATVAWWRKRWIDRKTWVVENADRTQLYMLLTTCVQLYLLYVSYNALTVYDSEKGHERWWNDRELQQKDGQKAQPDQIFAMTFCLVYFLTSQWHQVRFWPSTVFVLQAFSITNSARMFNVGSMYITFSGKMLFVINSLLNSLFAHEEEKSSRDRFLIMKGIEHTNKKIEDILHTLMPPLVVEELRRFNCSASTCSHRYKQATIAQSDLCGFTQLSAARQPHEVVEFVSDLFGAFDSLTDKYGIYKVETVGDAYIAGMAERPLTEDNIPVKVILFSLDMVDAVHRWSKRLAGDHEPVSCRVGVHFGECIGGIVGTDMQRYHMFGGLMTRVEVLESTGKPGMVQLSRACYTAVQRSMQEEGMVNDPESQEPLEFEERQDEDLRTSKGEMHSYEEVGGRTFLISRKAASGPS